MMPPTALDADPQFWTSAHMAQGTASLRLAGRSASLIHDCDEDPT